MNNARIEKMRYQENKTSYWLAMLALIFNIIFLFTVINNPALRPNYITAVKILANVVFLLTTFLSMERVKVYDKKWSYVLIGFGILSFIRILWMPLKTMDMPALGFWFGARLAVYLIIVGTLLVSSGLIAYKKSKTLEDYYANEKKA